jgi:hypothetical protein
MAMFLVVSAAAENLPVTLVVMLALLALISKTARGNFSCLTDNY